MKIIVLGAGVVGVTSAWYLSRQGHDVSVIERQPEPALETSFANGGQISVSHAEPWANPHAPLKALRWLGKEDAPLLFRLRADPALLGWTLRFLRECRADRYKQNMRHVVALALYSRQCLKQLGSELAGLQYDRLERGILHVYTDHAEYAKGIQAARLLGEFGCERRPVSAEQCLELEPALAPLGERLVGGDFAADDESGDARQFTRQLAEHCRRAGVQFAFGQPLARLETEQGRIAAAVTADGQRHVADAYVVALGSYGPALLRPLGISLQVYPVKGYSATFALSESSVAPTVSLIDDEYKIVFSRLGNRLRVAGTAEIAGFNHDPNPIRCDLLVRRTRELFPELNDQGEPEFWSGLRPVTPSAVPFIGRLRYPNLWVNTGHGTLGWTMACGSAAALSSLMGGRQPPVDFPFLG
ncbi:D-amino-acid dehydrogenase [Pseudogulbenkiania sp. NH8B]|uniref:D-amino acid dehydrogenase n=1 Tax=Pseudogulbenkiania sp. (strain NH8B) TaxID=748280 RepID=UPI0002279C25|nr:D-amino acid dehydrogenase [Pseudogulbenkiania sp. NH8B]BAK76454.1 D-amino-acid dehydrogenase [Pseudogulbenkiania sp. NH8B]